MDRAPDEAEPEPPRAGPPSPGLRIVATALAIVPGLGPLVMGRVATGFLLLFATAWIRLMLAGHAPSGHRLEAFLYGAPGLNGGLSKPTAVFLTLLVVATHVLAVRAVRLTSVPAGPRLPRSPRAVGE